MSDKIADDFPSSQAPGRPLQHGPRALSTDDDRYGNRVIGRLNTGVEIDIAPRDAQHPQTASSSGLDSAGVQELGGRLDFPTIDGDLAVASLLMRIPHSRRSMAACRDGGGGSVRGPAPAAVPRGNGEGAARPKLRRV